MKYFFDICQTELAQSQQNLGTFLENKLFLKWLKEIKVIKESCFSFKNNQQNPFSESFMTYKTFKIDAKN